MNKQKQYPFIVYVIALPIIWVIAIIKALIAIPLWIIGNSNEVIASGKWHINTFENFKK